MAAPPPPPPPARLTPGDVLAGAVALYRARPGAYIVIAIASALPMTVIAALFNLSVGPNDPPGRQASGLVVMLAAYVFLSQFSTAGTAVAVIDARHGRPPSAGRSLGAVGDRMRAVVGVGVISGVLIALGAFVLIPAVYLAIVWAFAGTVAVTERKGPMDALRRSSALVHRAFWWTLGMVTLVTVVFGLAALGMAAALDLVIAAPFDGDAAVVASSVSAFVAGIVVGPLTQIAAALIYMHRHAAVDGRRPAPVPDGLDVRA